MDKIKFLDIDQVDSSIKIIGVGGGGSNMVNFMYKKDVKGVTFIVCNTDKNHLNNICEVPVKIELGLSSSEGLGAGSDPVLGMKSAEESKEHIKNILENNTKMLFIVAGMGGGTGTGASPIIAEIAKKELNILTVAVVTLPFDFEGPNRVRQAKEGLEKLKKQVDSIIIICNQKLIKHHSKLGRESAFKLSNEILYSAVKPISDIATKVFEINVDMADIKKVMENGGVCMIGNSKANGENRAETAALKAITNNLLLNETIHNANRALIHITTGKEDVTLEEIEIINSILRRESYKENIDIKSSYETDLSLGDYLSVTVVATDLKNPEEDQNSNQEKNEEKPIYQTQKINPKIEPPKTIKKGKNELEEDVLEIDFDIELAEFHPNFRHIPKLKQKQISTFNPANTQAEYQLQISNEVAFKRINW